jgi:hypothetical protein
VDIASINRLLMRDTSQWTARAAVRLAEEEPRSSNYQDQQNYGDSSSSTSAASPWLRNRMLCRVGCLTRISQVD